MGYLITSTYNNNECDYSFHETTNGNAIRRVISDHDIKDFMFPFFVPELRTFKLDKLLDKNLTIYEMRVNAEIAGLAFFTKENNSAKVDNAFLPKFRGKDSLALGKCVIFDYINNHHVTELTGRIKRTNKRSLYFAQWLGFSIVKKDETYFYVRRQFNG